MHQAMIQPLGILLRKKKFQLSFQFTGLAIVSSELVTFGSELLSVLGNSWRMGLFSP